MNTATVEQFAHPALLYRDEQEYLAGTVPYIREGLAAGEPVAVAVPGRNLSVIQDALGADAHEVRLLDMAVVGRNPGRIIPAVLLAFADAHSGRRVRLIGEPIWAGRSPTEYPACAQHEALINAAFAGRAATILCPYNVRLLDPAWIEDAYKTHPVLLDTTGSFPSMHYDDPITVAAGFNLPLPDPPLHAATIAIDLDALPAARRFVIEHATRAGLTPQRVAVLILAVTELASNSIRHGGGTGRLHVWTDDNHLVCQLADNGLLNDPLAGRIPVPAHATQGRGLLLVNHFCDLIRVHTTATGTTIRAHLHR